MALYRRGNVWWMDVYQGADRRRIRKSTGTTDKNQARMIEQSAILVNRGMTTRQRAIAIIDNLLPIDEQAVKLDEASAYYAKCLADENIVLSITTREHRLNILSQLAMWAKDNTRAKFVEDVDSHIVFAFVQELNKRPIKIRTKNAYVGDLITIWKMFVKRSKARSNPWINARFQRHREEEAHGRAFTRAEIDALRTVARDVGFQWEEAIIIGLYTGQRESDCLNLRWRQVDFDNGMIHFSGDDSAAKTKRHGIESHIPMHPKLRAMLQGLPADGEFVLPMRSGSLRGRKYENGDVPFNAIIERAGIVAGEKVKLSFHCLRHTMISRLAEAGVAEDVRMRLAGHTSQQTHSIYTHDDVSGRRAIEMLD